MDISEMKEVREVVGADAANELLRQGWVLLEVRPSENMVTYGEDARVYTVRPTHQATFCLQACNQRFQIHV